MTMSADRRTPEPEGAALDPKRRGARMFGPRRRRPMDWRINLARFGVVVVIIGAWEFVTAKHIVDPILLPGPWNTLTTLGDLIKSNTLPSSVLVTLEAAAVGFIAAMVAGVILGFVVGLSDVLTRIFGPFITIFNSMPRIALAPMFALWFGIGTGSAVALVISMVFFIALTNTLSGTQSVDRNQITLARIYGASRLQTIAKIILPATVPWIVAAGRLSLANALAAAIVAEMFLGQSGLGYLITTGSGLFDMAQVFAAVLTALIIAAVLDALGTSLERRLLRWRPDQL